MDEESDQQKPTRANSPVKTTVLYTRVLGKSDASAPDPAYYEPFCQRFKRTYLNCQPTVEHELVICNCGIKQGANDFFYGIAQREIYYTGPGWDIGAYQHAARVLDTELLVCLAAPVYFWTKGWLERIVAAAKAHGPGLYGAMASNQNHPHLRTGAIAATPKILRDYPKTAASHMDCCQIESCPGNLTDWAARKNYAVLMVAATGEFGPKQWRTPENIFRRGTQENCLIWDRHCDIYMAADWPTRQYLERQANGH